MRRKNLIAMVALGALFGSLMLTGLVSAHTNGGTLIHACKNTSTKVLRLKSSCSSSEVAVHWPATAVPGPAGADGADGAPGADGADGPAGADGADGAPGADGADGNTILSGTEAPDDVNDGVDGDYYLDTDDSVLYGPKAAGEWPDGVSLVGPAGADGNDGAPGAPGVSTLIVGGGAKDIKKNETRYVGLYQNQSTTAFGADADAQQFAPMAGDLSGLKVMLNAGQTVGGTVGAYTFTIRKNGVDTGVTCDISFGANSNCEDAVNSVAFAEGDLISLRSTSNSSGHNSDLKVRWMAVLEA